MKEGINEFTITAKRAGGNYVDFTMSIGKGDLSQPEKDVVSPLIEEDLQTLHSTIRLFQAWEYSDTGFRTSDQEIWTLIGENTLVVNFWPTEIHDVDVDVTFGLAQASQDQQS